ncbi:hypothetical protein EV361DRAFT_772959, partial [Lentinula raphanica]
ITAHKSQGATYENIIVDLESCSGTEQPYVMLSRVRSLEGLIILRPFQKSRISCHQSQDIRSEMNRLSDLHNAT